MNSREYRLYNKVNCSLFDLIGYKEPDQTKALGYLFYRSSLALKLFLSLLLKPTDVKRLIGCRCVVDCEMIQSKGNGKSDRADIILQFYDNYTPVRAIIVEAKSVRTHIDNVGAANQTARYQNFASLKCFGQDQITNVTLTTILSFHSGVVKSVTWDKLIDTFMSFGSKDKLIFDYVQYLLKIQDIMKFYDKEVLVIPAGKTAGLVNDPNCGLYECGVNGKHYNARANAHPLYIAFVGKKKVTKLYKIKNIIRLDFSDQQTIAALNADPDFVGVAARLEYYASAAKKFNIDVYNGNERWVFLFDQVETIELPYEVNIVGKVSRSHVFKKLSDFIKKPNAKGLVDMSLTKSNSLP